MAVNTAADLEDRLSESLAWRRVELLALKRAIEDAESRSPETPLARGLSRSGIAMLYAHWEGFFKDSCDVYLSFVAKRRHRCSDLNDGLLMTVLSGLHRRVQSGDKVAAEIMTRAVRNPTETRARLPKDIVNTRSNLRHSVATDILGDLGLDRDMFSTREHLIDHSLCDARNSIAHGKEYSPARGTFSSLHEIVLELMESLRTELVTAAHDRRYLANSSGG